MGMRICKVQGEKEGKTVKWNLGEGLLCFRVAHFWWRSLCVGRFLLE